MADRRCLGSHPPGDLVDSALVGLGRRRAAVAQRYREDRWQREGAEALQENRLVRALRLAAKLPDPSAKLPTELTQRLVSACNEEMTAQTPSDRWMVLIDAVAQSPIRRQVHPSGLPSDATPELIEFAKENAGRIPSLAALTGVSVPPPPRPEILAKVPRTSRPAKHTTTTDDA